MTAIFDLPRVKKDDMHVSFQGNRLVVSWRTVKITEREESLDADDLGSGTRILRELEHKKYCRTIPLPEGTKVGLTPDRSQLMLIVTFHSSKRSVQPVMAATSS